MKFEFLLQIVVLETTFSLARGKSRQLMTGMLSQRTPVGHYTVFRGSGQGWIRIIPENADVVASAEAAQPFNVV